MALKANSLIHLVYASAGAPGLSEQAIIAIALQTREHNQGLGVTGMFLFADQTFFQVLEGPRAVVEPLYAHISRDPRHLNPTKIFEGPVGHRFFSDWTTGLSLPSGDASARVPGANDFFGPATCVRQLEASTTRDVLDGFREGAWRIAPHGAAPADLPPDAGLHLIERSRAWIDKSDLND